VTDDMEPGEAYHAVDRQLVQDGPHLQAEVLANGCSGWDSRRQVSEK
jgi:hypothetical protein